MIVSYRIERAHARAHTNKHTHTHTHTQHTHNIHTSVRSTEVYHLCVKYDQLNGLTWDVYKMQNNNEGQV